MPSTFTWLDYSEHERRKMLDVIDLFGEKMTRDELGLGGVRDAFADLLFPGTSTIQTRARYFLFIPWIYLELEEKRTSSARIGHRARKLETELALAIAESEDSAGLIGRRKKENIQRLPSNVYWQGLSTWGIRVFPGSQNEYHRSLDVFYARIRARRRSSHEYFGEAPEEADLNNWHPSVPSPPQVPGRCVVRASASRGGLPAETGTAPLPSVAAGASTTGTGAGETPRLCLAVDGPA